MDNSVGFGTIGYGMIARTHLAGMVGMGVLRPGATRAVPRALCTRRPEACADLPYQVIYRDWAALIADDEVAVVDICTPNDLHEPPAAAALKAGKSVYLEKPIAHTMAGALALARLAGQTGRPNQAALIMRFYPAVARMRDLLDAGAIGEVVHFRTCFYHGSYLDPDRPTSWRQQRAHSGGGAVMDLGIHVLDLARYFLGEVESLSALAKTVNPTRFADASRTATVPNDTDEYLCATLQMASGAVGVVESSRVSDSALCNQGFEIFGAKGSLYLDLCSHSLWLNRAGGEGRVQLSGAQPGPVEQALTDLLPPARQSLGAFVDAHAAAILNIAQWHRGLPAFCGTPTFWEAAKAQALVHACLNAAESGCAVRPESVPAF